MVYTLFLFNYYLIFTKYVIIKPIITLLLQVQNHSTEFHKKIVRKNDTLLYSQYIHLTNY